MTDFVSRWQEERLQCEAATPAVGFGLDDVIVLEDFSLALLPQLPEEPKAEIDFKKAITRLPGLYIEYSLDAIIYHAFNIIYGKALNQTAF